MNIEQVLPAQPGWYAVDIEDEEYRCVPVIGWRLVESTIHPLVMSEFRELMVATESPDFHIVIYAPHLVYRHHLLWTQNDERADVEAFRV